MEMVGAGSSKLLKTVTGDNELPLSVHVVVSNDDLLTEILLKLPIISLVLFKSVSRRWLFLITSPSFIMHRRKIPNIDPPSGLFIVPKHRPLKKNKFVPLDNRIPASTPWFITTFAFIASLSFQDSSNGLILCQTLSPARLPKKISPNRLSVYNPSINILKMLPKPPQINLERGDSCCTSSMRMVFDPIKSPHYKVVYASVGNLSIQIQTYSSETCNWRSSVCRNQFPIKCFIGFDNVIYWNDAIHWLNLFEIGLHYKLDIANDVPVLTHIQLPLTLRTTYWDAEWLEDRGPDMKLLESCGGLILLARYCIHPHQLYIYEMSCECSEWSLKYCVNLDDIMLPLYLPTLSRVQCIVFGEQNEDSFIVIGSDEKIVQYNFVSRTLCNLDETFSGSDRSFVFTASFAGV